MYPAVRPSAKFDRSLELLRRVKEAGRVAKTGIMVGIGERDEEVLELMDEVQRASKAPRDQGIKASREEKPNSVLDALMPGCLDAFDSCDILTIGQYLQPTRNHLPIDRWVTPAQFDVYRAEGLARGFKVVQSGALVRSSYHADDQADMLTDVDRQTRAGG
jgi:lipoic acid synthetase